MNSTRELHCTWTDRIFESQLAPYVDAFTHHLSERGYSSHTVGNYLACIAHFARWTSRCRLDIHGIDEDLVRRFLDDHLPHCNCARPVQRTHHHLRAALGHLLVVLRTNSVIAEHLPGMTPVDKELRRFDDHMKDVRGLAPKTRRMALHPVRLLLSSSRRSSQTTYAGSSQPARYGTARRPAPVRWPRLCAAISASAPPVAIRCMA